MVNRVRKQVSRSIGDTRPVEIVIKAQDQASKTFVQIKSELNFLGTTVDKVRQSVVMLGDAINNISASTVDSIAEVYRQAVNLKNFLSNDFAVAGISLVVGQLESLTKGSMNFGSTFSAVMEVAVGPGKAQKIGSTFGKVMGEQAFSSFVGSVNLIDQKIMQLWGSVNSIGGKINPGADVVLGASKGLIGLSEPLSIFRGMQEGVRKFSGGLVNTIQEIGQLQMGLSALQQVANFGPFNALIRQNIEFREQLVSTQSSLAATNDVVLGGTTLTNTANAIKALEGPVRASIQKMRRDSLELVGVTSKDLVGVYNILASQVSSVGGGLNDASNLTIDFAAALGTLGIPLHQAGQEITSILRGQVDQNSALAKSIGLTNQQLNSWKSQGVLIERVRERLEAFAEGNKMAARSVGGISSNIQEVFDNILMRAGEPLLDPLIDKLAAFYEVLNKNALDIQFFVSDLVAALIEVGEAISRMAAKASGPLIGMVKEMIMIVVNSVVKAVGVFEEVFNVVLPAIEPIVSFITFLAKNGEAVTGPILKLFLAAGAVKGAVATLGPVINTVAQLIPGLGEAMMLVDVRANGLLNQFANLTQSIGGFKAAGLLAMKNVESIPGALDNIAKAMGPLGGFAPMIAPIIPMVGTAGIALVGLTRQFPMLKDGIQGVLTAVPGLIDGLAKTAESSDFLNGALKGFAPMMKQAGEESAKYADANTLAAKANEKLSQIAKETATGMAKQVAQMALYSGAVFALFFAFDNLILKNEGMMALLGEIGQQLSDLGNMIMDFLRNPVVSAIIALGALTALIATGVIPNMIKMGIASVNAFKAEAVKNLGDFKRILMGLGDTVVQIIAKYTGLAGATTASAGADAKKVTVGTILEAQKRRLGALYSAERAKIIQEAAAKTANTAATVQNTTATGLLARAKDYLIAKVTALWAVTGGQNIAMMVGNLMNWARSTFTVAAAKGFLNKALGIFSLQALRSRMATFSLSGSLKALSLANLQASLSTTGLGHSLKFASVSANFQAIKQWAFGAQAATNWSAAGATATTLLGGSLKGAALAAKGLVTALGPMALAVVAIAAAAEAVRILHQEFFAGNQILKDYLKSIEEAQTKLENTRYQGRGGAEEAPETYWQNRLDIAQGNRGNFVTRAARFVQSDMGYQGVAKSVGITSVRDQRALADKGLTTFEGALQALADNEAGRIELSEQEKEFAKAFVDSLDRHVDRVTADTGETLTEVDQLIRAEEQRIPKLQGEMDKLVQDYNAGNITDEQFESERTKINEEMTNAIDYLTQMRDRLLALEDPDDAQLQQIDQLTDAIDNASEAYGNIDSAAIEQRDVSRSGSQQEQLSRRASTAEAFIVEGKGDPAEYAEQAKTLIESTNQMLETGMISEEEALRRLNLVATNTRLDAAIIAQAQESMTKAVEGQSQRRVATLQAEQSSVQAQMRQGTLTQVEGAEKLKTLTEQEGQERLNALDQQYQNSNRVRQQEEQDALNAQQENLDSLREQLAEAGPETVTGKAIAEEIATAEAAMAATRQSYADQALVAEQNYNNERVKIANETAENMIAAEERVHESKVRNLEQAQQLAQDTAKKAQLDTDILNQQLLNSGSITKEELAARNAESSQESIRAELESEKTKLAELEKLPKLTDPEKERERQAQIRAARLRTQELTLQLLQSERQEIETNIQLLETDLRNAAREYGNELEGQIQSLEQQSKINEQLTRAHENRVKLAEAEKNLRDATDSYVSSEFELLAETTNSEYRKKQIAQATAAIKLESAKMAAEFAKKSLEMEYEQNKLVRERELMENRMAILRAEQAVAQGNVDVQVAQEKFNAGLITKGELDAAILQQQGNMMNLDFTRQERGLILEQQANDERIFAMRAQQVDMEGRTSIRQAEIGLANALPPGLQQRALNQIGDNIAQDFGYESRSDMINAGMAMGRQMAQDEFGVGQSVGTLSAFDSSLEGLRETLSPEEYAAAVADSQQRFNRQMGPSAFSMQQDQLLGRDTEAFRMPSGSSMGQRDVPADTRSPQFADSLGMGIASAINRDVGALPSATTAGLGARDADRMIAAIEGGGRGEIQFNPVFQIEVNASTEEAGSAIAEQVHRELERVIEKSRELLRAA